MSQVSSQSSYYPSPVEYKIERGKLILKMDLEPETKSNTYDFDINIPGYDVNGSMRILKKENIDEVESIEPPTDDENYAVDIDSEETDIEKELLSQEESPAVVPPEEEEEVEEVKEEEDGKQGKQEPIPGTVIKVKQDNSFFRSIADQIYDDERWCMMIRHFCYLNLQKKYTTFCFLRKFAFDEEVFNCDLECLTLSNIYHLQIIILNTKKEIVKRYGDNTWNAIFIIAKKNGTYNSINTFCSNPISDIFTTDYEPGCYENHILKTLNIDVVLPNNCQYSENTGLNVTLKEDGAEAIIVDSIYATRNMLPDKKDSNKKRSSFFYYKLRFIDGTEKWCSKKKVEVNNNKTAHFISRTGRKVIPTNFYKPPTTI